MIFKTPATLPRFLSHPKIFYALCVIDLVGASPPEMEPTTTGDSLSSPAIHRDKAIDLLLFALTPFEFQSVTTIKFNIRRERCLWAQTWCLVGWPLAQMPWLRIMEIKAAFRQQNNSRAESVCSGDSLFAQFDKCNENCQLSRIKTDRFILSTLWPNSINITLSLCAMPFFFWKMQTENAKCRSAWIKKTGEAKNRQP